MARQQAGTVTIAAIAIALGIVCAVNSQQLPPSVIVAIQNNFMTHNFTIQCDSDVEVHLKVHLLLPKQAYTLHSNRDIVHQWTCTLSSEKADKLCGEVYNGEFDMWENNMLLPPKEEAMCYGKCRWFVDADGLSLIQLPGGMLVHIYDWPGYKPDHKC